MTSSKTKGHDPVTPLHHMFWVWKIAKINW